MSIARDTTEKNIKPLEGAVIRRYTLGATTAAGELVSMKSDGKCDPSDSTSAADPSTGVALQAGVDGDRVDVVVFGPVNCLTGATIGAATYNSATAGEPSEGSGGNKTIVGWAESATVLFFHPER